MEPWVGRDLERLETGERDASQCLAHAPPPALQGNQPNMTPPFEAPSGTGKFWVLCWWGQGEAGQGSWFCFLFTGILLRNLWKENLPQESGGPGETVVGGGGPRAFWTAGDILCLQLGAVAAQASVLWEDSPS